MEKVGSIKLNVLTQTPSLRRHDPDQVQRVRLTAISAPELGRPSSKFKLGPLAGPCQSGFAQISVRARRLPHRAKKANVFRVQLRNATRQERIDRDVAVFAFACF
jgi:hypothetical protein